MNRMGWVIALAGVWALGSLAVMGATNEGNPTPDCVPGFYLSASGWCVRDPQPTDAPGAGPMLVDRTSVGSAVIEPTTEGS